jgi:phage-related protein
LGSVGSGVNEILDDVEDISSGLTGDLSQIRNQLITILNVPQGTSLVGFLTNLIQQILQAVSKLIEQLLGDLTNLSLLNEILANLQLASLLQTLVGSLQSILDTLKVSNV